MSTFMYFLIFLCAYSAGGATGIAVTVLIARRKGWAEAVGTGNSLLLRQNPDGEWEVQR